MTLILFKGHRSAKNVEILVRCSSIVHGCAVCFVCLRDITSMIFVILHFNMSWSICASSFRSSSDANNLFGRTESDFFACEIWHTVFSLGCMTIVIDSSIKYQLRTNAFMLSCVCFRLARWVPTDRGGCPSLGSPQYSQWEHPPSGLCPHQMHLSHQQSSPWHRYGAARVQSTSMWTALGHCPSCRSSPPTLGWTPPCPLALPPLLQEAATPWACPVGPTSAPPPPPWAAVVLAVGAAWPAVGMAAEWYRHSHQSHRHSRMRLGAGEEEEEEEQQEETEGWQGTATHPSSVRNAASAAVQPAQNRGSCLQNGAVGTTVNWVPAGRWTCVHAFVALRLCSTTVGQRRTTRATMTHAPVGAVSAARAGRAWPPRPCFYLACGVTGRCGGAWQRQRRATIAAGKRAASAPGGHRTKPQTVPKRDVCWLSRTAPVRETGTYF